jgi:hypothetical protein
MSELRDRLERELNEVPVAPRTVSEIRTWADRRRKRRRIGTVALACLLTVGSIALISRAFRASPEDPTDVAGRGVESTPLVIDHITITDPLNGRSQVEAEAVATWSRGQFPGFHRCVFIARDQAGKEVGRYEDVIAGLSRTIPVRVDASSPASSMDGECGPRLDTGTPYRYDFSNVRVTNRDVLPGVLPDGVATVTYDAKWAGGGELAGAVSCRVAILDEGGSVVGSVGFNFYALTGSGTNLATRVDVHGTPASAEIDCSPFTG